MEKFPKTGTKPVKKKSKIESLGGWKSGLAAIKERLERRQISSQHGPRLPKVFENFAKSKEILESGLRPKTSILGDADHIENQEIDFIDRRDEGYITITFKLTAENYRKIRQKLAQQRIDAFSTKDKNVSFDQIFYSALKKEQGVDTFKVASAWALQVGELKVKISTGFHYEYYENEEGDKRSSLGLVTIDFPARENTEIDLEKLEKQITEVLKSVFEIEDGITPPTPEAERKYKEARYRWHHRMRDWEALDDKSIERLERKEVLPGYFTMVEEGKSVEYEKEYGKIAPFHTIQGGIHRIATIFETGLLSSHERFRRGMLLDGMSSDRDFETGGADSAFTRIVTDRIDSEAGMYIGNCAIVFHPRILDRTDWYAYYDDQFGTTEPEQYDKRESPNQFFKGISANPRGYDSNEQMFRTGIAPSEIMGIVYVAETYRDSTESILERILQDVKWELKYSDKEPEITKEKLRELWDEGPLAVKNFFVEKNLIRLFDGYVRLRFSRLQALILALAEKGITEINGKPIAEMLIPVHEMSDLIAIAHGEKPKPHPENKDPNQNNLW